MARRLERIKGKRSLSGVLEFLSKSINRICIGMIANTGSRLVYLLNPAELQKLADFTDVFIWGAVIISILCHIGLAFKGEDNHSGSRTLMNDWKRTKEGFAECLVLIALTFLIRPIAPQMLYIGLSTACVLSTSCIVIAYGLSKKNVKYFGKTSA